MTYVYDKSGQVAYITREESEYGMPYNPEADSNIKAFGTTTTLGDTPIPADYPFWYRFDVIPEGFDAVIPKLEKFKKADVGDFKHAGTILTGNYKPEEITFEMDAQALEFLVLAIGAPALSSHTQAMTQTITFDNSTMPPQGSYFLFDVIDSGGAIDHYAVWSDTANDQSTGKPTVTGINASNMLPANTSAVADGEDVADAVEAIIESTLGGGGTADITSANNTANVMTLIHARDGAVRRAFNGASSFGIKASASTWGCTNYTISEQTGTPLESFTIHLEQKNTTSGEDIIWDLYGCVIQEVSVSVAYEEGIVKGSVTFKCPYALENSNGRATQTPAKKMFSPFPSMSGLVESASNNLIMDGTTDKTPKAVESATLTITNNVLFKSDIGKRYSSFAYGGNRDVKLQIVGAIDDKDLFGYWQGAYAAGSGAYADDWVPSGATALNSKFKLVRNATYDFILVSIRNWFLAEHNFHFMSVDEAVKTVDMTLEDGTPDSNGRIIDDCDFVGYVDRVFMIERTTP